MILLITLMILGTFIPDPPDSREILTSYYLASETEVVVKGKVYFASQQNSIKIFIITIDKKGESRKTNTDKKGNYFLYNVSPGEYTITVTPGNGPYQSSTYKRKIQIPFLSLHGKSPDPIILDWHFIERNDSLLLSDTYTPGKDEPFKYVHFYIYDAKTKAPLDYGKKIEYLFSVFNDTPSDYIQHGPGLYSIKTIKPSINCNIQKFRYSDFIINVNTIADSIPDSDNIIYAPLIADADRKLFFDNGFNGKITSENSRYLPDSIKVNVDCKPYSYYSGKEGRFYIDDLPLGMHTFTFSHPMIDSISWRREAKKHYQVHDTYFKVFTKLRDHGTIQSGRLYGQILDQQTNLPIPDAKIELMEDEWISKTATYSDKSGFYLFRNLGYGTYKLRFSKKGYKTSPIIDVDVSSKTSKVCNIRKDYSLSTPQAQKISCNGIVAFKIINKTINSPQDNYFIYNMDTGEGKRSDSNGLVVFDSLSVGTHFFTDHHYINIKNPYKAKYTFEVPNTFKSGEIADTLWHTIDLVEKQLINGGGSWFSGYVADENNSPVSDADVYFLPSFLSVKTDTNGCFKKYLPNGKHEIQIVSPGFGLLEKTFDIVFDEKYLNYNHKEVFMLKRVSENKDGVSGTVYDAINLNPIPNVTLFILDTDRSTRSDENGNFVFNAIKPGKYLLEVTDLGTQAFTRWVDTSVDCGSIDIFLNPIPLTNHNLGLKLGRNSEKYAIEKPLQFSGTIFYSPSEVPVVAIPVYLHSLEDEETTFYCVTSQNGRFDFKIPEGQYKIKITSPISEEFLDTIFVKNAICDTTFSLVEKYSLFSFTEKHKHPLVNEVYTITIDSNKTNLYYSKSGRKKTAFIPHFYSAQTKKMVGPTVLFTHSNMSPIKSSFIHTLHSHDTSSVELPLFNFQNTSSFIPDYQTISFGNQAYFNDENLYFYLLPNEVHSDYYKKLPSTDHMILHHQINRYYRDFIYRPEYIFTDDKSKSPILQGTTVFIHGIPYVGTVLNDHWLESDPFTYHQFFESRYYITIFGKDKKPVTRSIYFRTRFVKTHHYYY